MISPEQFLRDQAEELATERSAAQSEARELSDRALVEAVGFDIARREMGGGFLHDSERMGKEVGQVLDILLRSGGVKAPDKLLSDEPMESLVAREERMKEFLIRLIPAVNVRLGLGLELGHSPQEHDG